MRKFDFLKIRKKRNLADRTQKNPLLKAFLLFQKGNLYRIAINNNYFQVSGMEV